MTTLRLIIGRVVYFLGWPFFYVYLRSSHRTRVILSSEDKILVVKNAIGKNEWGLPGGGLHKNEPPINGAIRELQEETGLKLDPKELKLMFKNKPVAEGHFKFFVDVFVASLKTPTTPKPMTKEIAEACWASEEDLLKNYNLQSHVRDLLETLLKG